MNLLPGGKSFAFTIIDDTDNSNVDNTKPIYDFLEDMGFRTTKTTWCLPPRDRFTGGSLQDERYRDFLVDLEKKGFEIALHNVGSGSFTREEIEKGLELFERTFGHTPKTHVNHSHNPDNLYWGSKRFVLPFSILHELITGSSKEFSGEQPNSPHFWGDLHKEKVRYTRNLVFNGIDTLAQDPKMPYYDPRKEAYSNYWFSSSDGQTVEEFNALIHPKNIDKLERKAGTAIVYTHFASGFLDQRGWVDPIFKERMEYLSTKNGWFVPAGTLLDHLVYCKEDDHFASWSYLFKLNIKWVVDRIKKSVLKGR
jgi:hypothetical protein